MFTVFPNWCESWRSDSVCHFLKNDSDSDCSAISHCSKNFSQSINICLTKGDVPLFTTILLFPAHFHQRSWHQLDLGGIPVYTWLCHGVELLSSTCAGRTVTVSGRLPSHPVSPCSSSRWTDWLTHLKVHAQGFCCWIFKSCQLCFFSPTTRHDATRCAPCNTYFNLHFFLYGL